MMMARRLRVRVAIQRGAPRNFSTNNDVDLNLRNDIKILGAILGSEIKKENETIFNQVEVLRSLGREWRQPGGEDSFTKMVSIVECLNDEALRGVARSFAHFLALSNSAEDHHRIRRIRNRVLEAQIETSLAASSDSCGGVFKQLLEVDCISPEQLVRTICDQFVDVVLTAHPTEVNRRTNLQKHHRIEELLCRNDIRESLTAYEKSRIDLGLQREITSIWASDELKRAKPTPVDEAKAGMAVVENVLWTAVPEFLRRLDDELKRYTGLNLPLDAKPVKFSSWMGGDRDGNPFVTPETTKEVAMLARWSAATLFQRDILQLRAELSLGSANEDVLARVGKSSIEPYRDLLRSLSERLDATIQWAHQRVGGRQANTSIPPLISNADLLEPLTLIHRSLCETGNEHIAKGSLTDTIRRVQCFGLSLLLLDVRQESTRHSEALDSISRYLGIGSYLQWDEETRRSWLERELGSRRPLLPHGRTVEGLGFSPTALDTLGTFDMVASMEPGSLEAYVISQCKNVSDILAVAILMQDAAISNAQLQYSTLRIVPLFETLDDLERAPQVMDELFSIPQYRGRIRNKQEVMVGYSNSAKDAGRLAASWAQYLTQEKIAKVAAKHGVQVTFFHGKGGTVGRGGNPALFHAILAHPPHTINGKFRVTEQGEMITRNYGQVAIAICTLDLLTAGVLAERYAARPDPKREWREAMQEMSTDSCAVYRNVVREDPRFVPYFKTATPEQELGGLNVGSRPAKRNPKGGVESLRAIPWNFSWTQTRLNLPTWLGVGDAFNAQLQTRPNVIKDMHENWPWFATLVDLLDLICIKSDSRIAKYYDEKLVGDKESKKLGEELRTKFDSTKDSVLAVSGASQLQEKNPVLRRSLQVRNPYIDPLNIIQAEVLRRMRTNKDLTEEQNKVQRDTLLITINGVANGMRNSG